MKNRKGKEIAKKTKRDALNKRLLAAAKAEIQLLLEQINSSLVGLNEDEIIISRENNGSNEITERKKEPLYKRFFQAYINPFTIVLFILVIVSLFMDVIFTKPEDRDFSSIIIISLMVTLSGTLRFIQETRSGQAADKLKKMVHVTTAVVREGEKKEIPLKDVVVGDIIHLAAGDMVPADMRVLQAKDLYIRQSSLTGESEPIEKFITPMESKNPLEINNLAFMGTNVISGSAVCLVITVGDDTYFGSMAQEITGKKGKTSFEKGINSVSWVLIRFMMVMVPIIFLVNGITKGLIHGSDNAWLEALLFGLAIAVGLTPEMLPMIVTTGLAKGAVAMSKKKVIVKNLNSIQNLGAIDILCTDKTGTLTQDKVVLEYYYDVLGNEDNRVLRHAFLNSYYQTGLKNLMDLAIINHSQKNEIAELCKNYEKVDEIPFDFNRRRMSVVVKDHNGKTQMITKGAIEEMLSICIYAEYHGEVIALTEQLKKEILARVNSYNEDGLRVLGVAQKNKPSPVGVFSVQDETDMVFIGYLAFLDPAKESSAAAINALHEHGIKIKILTGDNDGVTRYICRQVGLDAGRILLGGDVEEMTEAELSKVVETTTIFAKLSPSQKSRIVRMLRNNGHTVGYMGDGINDAAAMRESDVGISVDTGVDIAKECADIILLEKDLMVLEKGIIEGRKTYGNIIKYIKMTASSNFGNMFSMLIASAFLPFLPMLPLQLLMLNLIYDVSCIAIPWDSVDKEFLKKPRKWDARGISKFMLWIGPTSSIFDITTYILMYFVVCPAVLSGAFKTLNADQQVTFIALFQAGWFVESLWSQTLVIHMIRTPKIPFIKSRASLILTAFTCIGILVGTIIPFTSLGSYLKMESLAAYPGYFGWLIFTIMSYMLLTTLAKKVYIKKYGELL